MQSSENPKINLREFQHPNGIPLAVGRYVHRHHLELHHHDFHELVIVIDGEAYHTTSSESYRIGAGDVFLIRPGDPHGYDKAAELELINVLYWRDRLNLPFYDLGDLPGYHAFFELEPEMRSRNGFRKHLQVNKKNLAFLLSSSRELERILAGDEPGKLFAAVAIFMQLIHCVSGGFHPDEAGNAPHTQLWRNSRILSEIERRWNQPIEFEKIAAAHGMSHSTLYRWFQHTFRQSPQDYLLTVRTERARELLQRTRQPISQIAAACGFSDSNYFSRCFKQRTGQTPSQFRQEKNI